MAIVEAYLKILFKCTGKNEFTHNFRPQMFNRVLSLLTSPLTCAFYTVILKKQNEHTKYTINMYTPESNWVNWRWGDNSSKRDNNSKRDQESIKCEARIFAIRSSLICT